MQTRSLTCLATRTRMPSQALQQPKPPAELAGQYTDAGLYGKSQAYSLDKW